MISVCTVLLSVCLCQLVEISLKGNAVLTKEDQDNIRAFKLKMMANMPHQIYDQLWLTFHHKMPLTQSGSHSTDLHFYLEFSQ